MPVSRLIIPDLEERPAWWLVRPEEISQIGATIRRGRSECLTQTPGGWPVYAIFYDPPDVATHPRQTLLFCAGMQGAEPAGVAAAINLIALLEGGQDRLGRRQQRLRQLLHAYRLIIIPCLNMDGRQGSPDHLQLASSRDINTAICGCWADGSLITWPRPQEELPVPLTTVGHPGGYPNADGFSILHDTCPGYRRTPEAEALFQLAQHHAIDMILNARAGTDQPSLLSPPEFWPRRLRADGQRLQRRVNQALFEADLRDTPPEPEPPPLRHEADVLTLTTLYNRKPAMTFSCGSASETGFTKQLDAHFIALTAILESGQHDPFSR